MQVMHNENEPGRIEMSESLIKMQYQLLSRFAEDRLGKKPIYEGFLTKEEVAAVFKLKEGSIRVKISRGELPRFTNMFGERVMDLHTLAATKAAHQIKSIQAVCAKNGLALSRAEELGNIPKPNAA